MYLTAYAWLWLLSVRQCGFSRLVRCPSLLLVACLFGSLRNWFSLHHPNGKRKLFPHLNFFDHVIHQRHHYHLDCGPPSAPSVYATWSIWAGSSIALSQSGRSVHWISVLGGDLQRNTVDTCGRWPIEAYIPSCSRSTDCSDLREPFSSFSEHTPTFRFWVRLIASCYFFRLFHLSWSYLKSHTTESTHRWTLCRLKKRWQSLIVISGKWNLNHWNRLVPSWLRQG